MVIGVMLLMREELKIEVVVGSAPYHAKHLFSRMSSIRVTIVSCCVSLWEDIVTITRSCIKLIARHHNPYNKLQSDVVFSFA